MWDVHCREGQELQMELYPISQPYSVFRFVQHNLYIGQLSSSHPLIVSCCWSCKESTIESKWESTITQDSMEERWSSILCVCVLALSIVLSIHYYVGLIYNSKPSPTVLYILLLYVIHHLQTWDVSPLHMKGLVTQNVVSNRNIIWTRLLLS